MCAKQYFIFYLNNKLNLILLHLINKIIKKLSISDCFKCSNGLNVAVNRLSCIANCIY